MADAGRAVVIGANEGGVLVCFRHTFVSAQFSFYRAPLSSTQSTPVPNPQTQCKRRRRREEDSRRSSQDGDHVGVVQRTRRVPNREGDARSGREVDSPRVSSSGSLDGEELEGRGGDLASGDDWRGGGDDEGSVFAPDAKRENGKARTGDVVRGLWGLRFG